MKKIKVLQVCYSLKAAGIETFVANLQQSIDYKSFDIHFLIYKNKEIDLFYKSKIESCFGIIQDASAMTIKNFLLRHIIQRVNFCKILQKENYNLIHIHASSGLQGIEVLIAHILGVKNIIVHSHSSNLSASSKFNRLKKIIHLFGLVIIKNYATEKLACSEKAANWLFPNQESVILVHNGIQCLKYKFQKNKRDLIRQGLNITKNQMVIGHIGSFSEIKNHRFLIEIFKEILQKVDDALLLLIGEGKLKESIVALAQKEAIEKNIIFLGAKDNCNELLMSMDYFVFPSLWEGMPITLIEAQASGLPCIVSHTITRQVDLCGVMRFVSLNASPKKWCQIILSQERSTSRENYASIVEKCGFDTGNMAIQIENIYKRIIK